MEISAGAVADVQGVEENTRLLCQYLRALLEEQIEGDCPQYESFLQEYALLLRQAVEGKRHHQKKLFRLVHGLVNSMGAIHACRHRELCEETLGVRLHKYTEETSNAIIDMILNMAWADSSLVVGCVRALAINLLPFDVPPKPSFDTCGRWLPSQKLASLQTALLGALAKIAALSPTLSTYLVRLVASKAPFVYRPTDAHGLYTRVLSQLLDDPYMASEQETIFSHGIAHVLSIDAEFGDEIEKRDGEGDEENEEMEKEEDMLVHDDDFVLEELDKQEELKIPVVAVNPVEMMDIFRRKDARVTLDVLMQLWLDHFERKMKAGQTTELWALQMSAFDSIIVNTHGVRCTPFLIFYMCNQDEYCRGSFVHHCKDRALNTMMPPPLRCAYVSYLASFMARSALLTTRAVVDCLVPLIAECERYARLTDERDLHHGLWRIETDARMDMTAGSSSQNTVFYSMIQGILYVLCYRMQEVFDQDKAVTGLSTELRDLVERRLGALLHHSLDPMNHCGAAIVVQFAHQAHVLGVLDCMELIDTENLHRYGMKIDAFFPFDPYPLPHSSHYLRFEETYVKWKDRKMDVDMETVYNAGQDHDGSSQNASAKASLSHPKSIPVKHTCTVDEPMGEFQDFSFSAGLTPMSVGNG